VKEHAAAWKRHWRKYFQHRAVNGLGVEMGSPTYAKYSLQNYLNIADLSPNLTALAGDFLQLWFADVAHAFLPSTGVRRGAHNRVYRDSAFFNGHGAAERGVESHICIQKGYCVFFCFFSCTENPRRAPLGAILLQFYRCSSY
jgi:hypothetical protein